MYRSTIGPQVSQELLSNTGPDLRLAVKQTPLAAVGALSAEVVVGSQLSREILQDVQHLRQRLGVVDDLRTDLPYLLGFHDERRRRPVTVLLRVARRLRAVVIFCELRHLALSTGIYLAGDVVGDGAVIGNPAELTDNVNAAVDALLRHSSARFIRICVGTSVAEWPLIEPQRVSVTIKRRAVRRRLNLAPTFPAMLRSFGSSTRRHLNRKRILLEEQGRTRFVPSLEPMEAFQAMVALNASVHPRRSLQQHGNRYRLLMRQPTSFAMGLQDVGGEWLSFLSGWRSNGRTYIDLQMNNFHFSKESISAVMRSYMLEHEITRQQTDVVFVGGSSILLQRYCEEDESCLDLLFRRKGVRSAALEKAVRLASPKTLVEYLYGGHSGSAIFDSSETSSTE